MAEIPLQLKNMSFNRVLKKTKKPFEKDWTNKPYTYQGITTYFPKENYGVMTGINELGVLDDDSKDKVLIKLFEEKWEESFRVRDHYYIKLLGWDGKKIIFSDSEGTHLGELQGKGQMVVGAGSIHPSGEVYDLRKDIPIKEVLIKDFLDVFSKYIKNNNNQQVTATEPVYNSNDDNFIKQIKKKWKAGDRQNLTLSVAGYLRKEKRFGLDRTLEIIKNICGECGDSDWEERRQAIEETYRKDEEKIKGITGLNERDINLSEDKIKSFLKEQRKKFESLGCGYHDGVYYFGTKLFKDGRSFNAVVTSDKKLYIDTRIKIDKDWVGTNEIRYLFGLNYKGDFYDESLDNILTNKTVEKWLFENPNITIKEVYEKIIIELKKYIYLEDERKYSLLACYRIAGFFMPIWKTRARLFLYAEMGSAKSRLTQILHNSGFNSVSLGDWTLAYLKTIIQSTRGESHIDDFETLSEELKNATTRLVKVGFMKGFKAGKMSEGKRKPEVNDLFNTTTLNNTEGIDFISKDRCITIRIPKISKAEYDKEPDFEKKIWEELRDNLYILGMKYPQQVKEVYEKIKSDRIRGRLFSIIKPELTIAKLISDKVYNDLEDFWVEEIEQNKNIDYETDWEFLAYKQIYKYLSPLSTNSLNSPLSPLSPTSFSLLNDIIKPIGEKIYSEEEFKKKKRSMSIIIGNSLSRSPIFRKKLLHGRNQYNVKFDEFLSLLKAKGFYHPILQILNVKEGESGDRGESKVPTGETSNIKSELKK